MIEASVSEPKREARPRLYILLNPNERYVVGPLASVPSFCAPDSLIVTIPTETESSAADELERALEAFSKDWTSTKGLSIERAEVVFNAFSALKSARAAATSKEPPHA